MHLSTNDTTNHQHSFAIPQLHILIASLSSNDVPQRRHALRELVRRGSEAVSALSDLLQSPHEHVRWEAAKALGRIGGPQAAEALASSLDDESLDVRWTAANGLIAIGPSSLVPVLHTLIGASDSVRVRQAAAHVFYVLQDEKYNEAISPVLSALKSGLPIEKVLVAAHEALNCLKKH